MLYHLAQYITENAHISGVNLLSYISFRSSMAIVLSLLIAIVFGSKIIDYLKSKQIKETVRDLGLQGEKQKKGTPTMGGLIIILSIIVPTVLLCDLTNHYVLLMLFTTVWLGVLGFIERYSRKIKMGLRVSSKLLVKLGLV